MMVLYQSNDYTALKHKVPESVKSMWAVLVILESNQPHMSSATHRTRRKMPYFNETKGNAKMEATVVHKDFRIPFWLFCIGLQTKGKISLNST